MATTTTGLLPQSEIDGIDVITNGTYWALDSSRTITWATSDFFLDYWSNPIAGAAFIGGALSKFQEVANIRFQYVGHYADPNFAPANMVFSATSFPFLFGKSNSVVAWAYSPNEEISDASVAYWFGDNYPNAAGDVWINLSSEAIFYPSYPGSDGFFLFLHEIGHAIGLKHPHDNGGTGRPTATALGIDPADIQLLTVMSYKEGSPVSSWWAGNPGSLMPLDIFALQWLYGPNNSTRDGNTSYSLQDDGILESFWDAGGTDLASAATSSQGWNIVLGIGDKILGHEVGLAAPKNSLVTLKYFFDLENAVGSLYSDTLIGNGLPNALTGLSGADTIGGQDGNDTLYGGTGNDTLDGGVGIDTALFAGNRASYTISRPAFNHIVSGIDGSDTLSTIERLQFSDKKIALDLGVGQSAGNTVKIIGAAFDAPAIQQRPDYVGVGLDLFDSGTSMLSVCQLAIGAMGSPTYTAFVNMVYQNLFGVLPSTADRNFYVGLLQGGTMTQAQLLEIAANSDINAQSINLVGLQQSGVEFI